MAPIAHAASACPWTTIPQASDSPPSDSADRPASADNPWTILNRLGQTLNQTLEEGAIAVDPHWLVAIAAPPLLGALTSARVINAALDQLGATSEELFRGDRLPVLHLTDPRDRTPDPSPQQSPDGPPPTPPQSPGAP